RVPHRGRTAHRVRHARRRLRSGRRTMPRGPLRGRRAHRALRATGGRRRGGRVPDLARAIADANARFYRAFAALARGAMDAVWGRGEDVTCVPPGWSLLTGWPAVRESWRAIFENTEEMRFTISNVQVVTGGDLGWVTCTENILSDVQGRVTV